MSSRRFTVEAKRELVQEYIQLPYGSKGAWLERLGISAERMRMWRRAFLAGTLELGISPRDGIVITMEEEAAVVRLLQENQRLREQLLEQQARHECELAQRQADVAREQRAVAALGKAIELLQAGAGGKSQDE